MQSLINDADIAASFIGELTPSLTRMILIESGNLNPNVSEIQNAIFAFKSNFHLTTKIAKEFVLAS